MIWVLLPGMAERVVVMYGGYIIEEAYVKDLYGAPEHPYTIGLLGSLPRLDMDSRTRRLTSIDGLPPVLLGKTILLPVCSSLYLCRGPLLA